MEFLEAYENFYKELGESRKMVLSTSLNDVVTSRMMSVVVIDKKLYFQTDRTLRKYNQLKANPKVSFCIDNVQIEGNCEEIGVPADNAVFSCVYKKCFPNSYSRYSSLKNECLFAVTPTFIEKWRYINDIPYMEILDIENKMYELKRYAGE